MLVKNGEGRTRIQCKWIKKRVRQEKWLDKAPKTAYQFVSYR